MTEDKGFWLWLWAPLLVVASSSFFVGAWIATILLFSWLIGWRELASRYRAIRPHSGERFRLVSARMRWGAVYHGSAYLSADSDGLYLTVMSLFRAGHPPLFIPWSDISSTRERRWWVDGVGLRFTQAPGISLHVRTEEAVKAFAKGPLRLDA